MAEVGRRLEKLLVILAWSGAFLVPLVFATLFVFLLWRGLPGWNLALFFGDTPPLDALLYGAPVFEGLWSACLGTLYLVGLAALLAIPLGVASGIFLAEYASGRRKAAFALCVDLLAGIPSVLMGLFGFALILLLRKTCALEANTGLLLSAFCLALLILPYLISSTRLSIESLPATLKLTGASLGLGRWQVIRRILLPAAGPGISGGIILALGRAAEDTAVILLTGVVANAGTPDSLNGKYEALPFHIYYLAAEYQTAAELTQAFAAALVLLGLTGLLFLVARRLQRGLERQWKTGKMN